MTGTIDIKEVATGTWNENANGNKLVVNDPTGITLNVGQDNTVAAIIVSASATDNVVITNNGTVTKIDAQAPINLVNNGTVADIVGNSRVVLSGNGVVTKATNTQVVREITDANSSLDWEDAPMLIDGMYKGSFVWGSANGIGSKLVEKSGRYNYYNDGAYLEITVRDGMNEVAFNTLFEDLGLQTDGGTIDSIKGSSGRQLEDWNSERTGFFTKLKAVDSKSIYYGVRQTGTGTDVGKTRTVGFNEGENRLINLYLTPKSDIAPGNYLITFDVKQQKSPTTGESIGNSVSFSFTISSSSPELQ